MLPAEIVQVAPGPPAPAADTWDAGAALVTPPVAPAVKVNLAVLPYSKVADMVPAIFAQNKGATGEAHDQVLCGPPMPPNFERTRTALALKLFEAGPCPEVSVILNVLNKVRPVGSGSML